MARVWNVAPARAIEVPVALPEFRSVAKVASWTAIVDPLAALTSVSKVTRVRLIRARPPTSARPVRSTPGWETATGSPFTSVVTVVSVRSIETSLPEFTRLPSCTPPRLMVVPVARVTRASKLAGAVTIDTPSAVLRIPWI